MITLRAIGESHLSLLLMPATCAKAHANGGFRSPGGYLPTNSEEPGSLSFEFIPRGQVGS